MPEKIRNINLEVPAPPSLNILDSRSREEILSEVKRQVQDEVAKLVERAVQKAITRKLNLATAPPKRLKGEPGL